MIQGKRVLLRAIEPDDYPRLTVFKNDIEFELLTGGEPPRPRTLAAITEFFDEMAKDKSGINFAIEVDSVFIGDCGLFHFNERAGTAELGIGIGDPDYRGKGYGREAMTLLVDYGFRLLNLRKIWLETTADNERAIRSYQAVGFVQEGRQVAHAWSDGRYVDVVLMGLFAADFAARHSAS
jgi:RimJ/RimL family protein N-acetyltransferase